MEEASTSGYNYSSFVIIRDRFRFSRMLSLFTILRVCIHRRWEKWTNPTWIQKQINTLGITNYYRTCAEKESQPRLGAEGHQWQARSWPYRATDDSPAGPGLQQEAAGQVCARRCDEVEALLRRTGSTMSSPASYVGGTDQAPKCRTTSWFVMSNVFCFCAVHYNICIHVVGFVLFSHLLCACRPAVVKRESSLKKRNRSLIITKLL
jgi:hypothetical protein